MHFISYSKVGCLVVAQPVCTCSRIAPHIFKGRALSELTLKFVDIQGYYIGAGYIPAVCKRHDHRRSSYAENPYPHNNHPQNFLAWILHLLIYLYCICQSAHIIGG